MLWPRLAMVLSVLLFGSAAVRLIAGGPEDEPRLLSPADHLRIRHELNLAEFAVVALRASGEGERELRLSVPIEGRGRDLVLWEHPQGGVGRVLICSGGVLAEAPAPAVSTYRGIVAGVTGSRVAATVDRGQLHALILLDGGILNETATWYIQPVNRVSPDAGPELHVVYRAADAPRAHQWRCGGAGPGGGNSQVLGGGRRSGPLVCRVAVDADFAFYEQNGASVEATVSDIMMVMNNVSFIFETEVNISLAISDIIVRTTDAPYLGGVTSTELLLQLQEHWRTNHCDVDRHVTHLFSGTETMDPGIAGRALLSSVCSHFSGYGYSRSRYTHVLAWRTALTAHELGHNFGARHCNEAGGLCEPCALMSSWLGANSLSFACSSAVISDFAAASGCLEPASPPVGACCAANGSCHHLTSSQCAAASGQFHGNGSTCGAAMCSCELWSPIGSGMYRVGGEVRVQALVDYQGNLVAGGNFHVAGGKIVNFVAAWDGTSWQSLGCGLNDGVRALIEYDNELVAGGLFTRAGGQEARYVARWDGASWHPLGSGMNGQVGVLAEHGGDLIAGGLFTTAGGQLAARIARWDGTSWHALGAGMGGIVTSLASYEGELIAGGGFTIAGGTGAERIAKWNGTSWEQVGVGVNSIVTALRVYGGELVVGGNFTVAGGQPASRIVRWDGSVWKPLDSGVNDAVTALAVLGSELIASGWFSIAGGQNANFIARWNGADWQPFDGQPDGIIDALFARGGELLAGGGFLSAGGQEVQGIAARSPCTPLSCYANCDGSTVEPILNVDDFTCFTDRFAAAQALPHEEQVLHYANCDGSTQPPVLNVDDYTCFISRFAAGCP
jgi:hypothetical protein